MALAFPVARSGGFAQLAVATTVALAAMLSQGTAFAKGPESVADVAVTLLDFVVNISTSQTVTGSRGVEPPQLPDGSPFQDFFDDFFDRQPNGESDSPRRVQSLGSGFVIDAAGIIVTNNHVIEGADEITANFNDGTKLTATLVGTDEKTDIAVLKVEPPKPLKAIPFGDSGGASRRRLGDGDRQPLRPRRHRDRGHRLGPQPRHQFRSL